jgi:hypothetical protein
MIKDGAPIVQEIAKRIQCETKYENLFQMEMNMTRVLLYGL